MFEVERKFLVKEIPNLKIREFYNIEQGYINFNPEIKVINAGNDYYLTQKGIGSIKRREVATTISSMTYNILSELIRGRIIRKVRNAIKLPNYQIAYLDVYLDDLAGLITVKVDFETLEDANKFVVPNWFGEEITDNLRYKNRNLSTISLSEIGEIVPQKGSVLSLK